MKKGMLFGLSHRGKRVKKINLLHFSVFTSKKFVILKLPKPSTDFQAQPSIHSGIWHIKQFLENFAVVMINGLNNLNTPLKRSVIFTRTWAITREKLRSYF